MSKAIRALVALLIAAITMPLLAQQPPDDAALIARVLDDWHDAAAKADEARYFAHFTPDAVFMGTDATERWTTPEFRAWAKPYFDRGKAWSFKPLQRRVFFSADKHTAWFDETLDTPNLGPCRGTGVLILADAPGQPAEWKIAHYNLSVPIPNSLVDQVVRLIRDQTQPPKEAPLPIPPTPAPPPPTAAASIELKVMTFNIRYGAAQDGDDRWELRRDMLSDLLREQNADLIGLQEALRFQLDEIHGRLPGFDEVGVGRDDGKTRGEYAAILFRAARFDLDEASTAWFSDTPTVPGSRSWGNNITRICTWARLIDRPTRRAFYIYNLHLDHESQPSREKSVQMLLDAVAARRHPDPVIITGDFNAGETNAAVRMMIAGATPPHESIHRSPFVDSFRVLHPDAKDVGTFHAFKGNTDGDKIDYIFVEPRTEILDAAILHDHHITHYPSDHFPVTARIRNP